MTFPVRFLPDWLVRVFAGPYVAGDSLDRGMEVARRLWEERRLETTLDLLWEGIRNESEIAAVRTVYRDMVEACGGCPEGPSRPTISLKPSSYTSRPLDGSPGADAAGSEGAIREIAGLAKDRGVDLTIDMEDRHWTDWTLDLLRRLREEGYRNVGGVLQTRLHRTAGDIEALPEGLRVRLVIGIYLEPEEVATGDKRLMKERMLSFARTLLERGHYVEFATHDEACIRRFLEEVVPGTGAGSDRYEIQMLYGVPRASFQRKLVEGRVGAGGPVRVRLYVPFATSWAHALAYCRRRLEENPSMAGAVARNLGRVLTGRR